MPKQYFNIIYVTIFRCSPEGCRRIPLETLNMIENVAKQCADSMQGGGGGLDEKALMSSMSGLFGGLLKNK